MFPMKLENVIVRCQTFGGVCMGNGKGNPEFYVAEIQLGAHSMPVCINNAPTAYHTAPLLVVPVIVPG